MGAVTAAVASTALEGFFNAREARKSRAFTRQQMQNKHQWQVADLEAAGLNRILSANMNPSIGSSAQASISRPQFAEAQVLKQTAKKTSAEASAAEAEADRQQLANKVL